MIEQQDSFKEFLSFEKRYSIHTVTAYIKDISDLSAWLNSEGFSTWKEIDSKTLRIYFSNLKEQGLEITSINRKISTLKTFFKYLLREGLVEKNPTDKIQILKKKKRLPYFVPEKNLEQLFDELHANLQSDDFDAVRNLLIIEIFYATGIRLSELIGIELQNISKSPFSIKVLGKRNKERIIPLYSNLEQQLEKYLILRENIISREDKNLLFLTKEGKRMYPKLVYNTVKGFLTQVSTNKKLSPHILRHTFATHMLNNGADLNAIKEILGHAGLSSTQVYTHNSISKLKEVYKNSHPRL